MDFVRVDRKEAFAVVEREGNFRRRKRLARRGAVEDDVGHFVAAKAFRALFAERPFDRVDDVRLPGAVRADEGANTLVQLDSRPIRETLEAV